MLFVNFTETVYFNFEFTVPALKVFISGAAVKYSFWAVGIEIIKV